MVEKTKEKGYNIIMLNWSDMGKSLYKRFGFKEIENGMILNVNEY